jgi:hypothetical protein
MDGSQVEKAIRRTKNGSFFPGDVVLYAATDGTIKGQMSDGLNKNILQLTEQQRTVNEHRRKKGLSPKREAEVDNKPRNKKLDF